ncbi:hypothetical protein SO802_012353 [Lithocarpus litseifolius]|uniref:Zinc knuckle CX2CX4HX4C domain-containing protein n=1 Tax=Lithocarpus litseifolius TaxID=425828 RepID=A0AAW2D2I3_9ROSI
MDRVLMLSPWTFDKYLVALHKLETDEQVKTVNFDKASFWVQIHDLPPRRMKKDVGVSIGRTLGEVEDVDMGEEGKALGRCIRVKLNRGRLVSFGSRESLWVNFKYERLLIFCYWCGKLNHDDKDCVLWISSKGSLRKEDQQYGVWLRASTEKPRRVQVVPAIKQDQGDTKRPPGRPESKDKWDKPQELMEVSRVVASPPDKRTMVEGDEDKLAVEIDESQRMGCTSMDPSREPVKSMGFEEKLKEIDQAIFGELEPMGTGENFQNLSVVSDTKRQHKVVNHVIGGRKWAGE